MMKEKKIKHNLLTSNLLDILSLNLNLYNSAMSTPATTTKKNVLTEDGTVQTTDQSIFRVFSSFRGVIDFNKYSILKKKHLITYRFPSEEDCKCVCVCAYAYEFSA